MHLSRYAARVTMLVRRATLSATMSDYLCRAIEAAENIDVMLRNRGRSAAAARTGSRP